MDTCRQQIAELLRAVTFHSSTGYSWSGRSSPRLPRAIRKKLSACETRKSLLYWLKVQLYQDFYCQGGLTAGATETGRSSAPVHSFAFTEELSAANCGRGSWEAGWEVQGLINEQVLLARNGLVLRLPNQGQAEILETAVVSGSALRLRMPKEFPNLMPGFYIALSDQPFVDETSGLLRLYWNLTPPGAIQLMQLATRHLNGAGLPFKCKVLNDPDAYRRCDAGVLYIRQEDYLPVIRLMEGLYPEIQPNLKPLTPIFTKRLAHGLGLAEDPGQGESLGMQRCRILAEGMLRANEQGKTTIQESMLVIESCFMEEGIRLDEPFLNLGSQDRYPFHCGPGSEEKPGFSSAAFSQPSTKDDFLQTAIQIGKNLSEKAIWHQQFCNWLGPKLVEGEKIEARLANAYGALGPDVYAGTSGVALFLGELYRCTREAHTRKTASGAIRHALASIHDVPPSVRAGLFSGWSGTALAAAWLSRSLEQPELAEMARKLLHEKILTLENLDSFDMLSGKAGAIVACLILQEILGDAEALGFAVRMGDELIDRAVSSTKGISWKTPGLHPTRNLTGFSHGSAGAAYALLELFSVTGDTRYSQAGQKAFEYERGWFNSRAANWPDFREPPILGPGRKKTYAYANAWCHGAPGIAISRLRAYELFGDRMGRDEARIALQTTGLAIEESLKIGEGNYSLCHGLAGNSEVLLYGAQVLASDLTDWQNLAVQAGIFGNHRYAAPGRTWPCGSPGGESPGLMTGLAGIGYFYLHLAGAPAPFILAPRREEFK